MGQALEPNYLSKKNNSYYTHGTWVEVRGQLEEVGSFISRWCPRNKTQVIRLGSKDIYPLTNLDSSQIFFVIYFTSDLKIYFKDG